MADAERSFGWLVVGRAWWLSWRFFEDAKHDIALGVIALVYAAYQHLSAHGFSASLHDVEIGVMNFLAPFVIVWAALFIWHLWLAPAALVYETTKAIRVPAVPPAPAAAPRVVATPINWLIWKQMDQYTLRQFSAILSKNEPNSTKTPYEQAAFLDMLLIDAKAGKLPFIRELLEGFGRPTERSLDNESSISKVEAIKWADSHEGFDVSHIR